MSDTSVFGSEVPRFYIFPLYIQRNRMSSVGGDVSIDSETILMIDFMNLKIKSAQSFKGAYTYVHRSECSYVYKYLCLYCVSK
jgi:hypothetical protein